MKVERAKYASKLADDFASPASIIEETELRKVEFAEELLEIMQESGISRIELARKLGIPPSRVTSMLGGYCNFTIETMVKAARAVNATWHQKLVPDGKKMRWQVFCKDEQNPRLFHTPKPDKTTSEFGQVEHLSNYLCRDKHLVARDDSRTAA